MKLILISLFFISKSYALDLFIEPGLFVDMFDTETVKYNDGSNEYDGTLRNKSLSYAMKFGVHYGKWEFGLDSEVYSLVAHFKGEGSQEDFSKEVHVTYNSLFVGYEFYPKNILYLSISNTPYLTSGTESYTEHTSVFSMEYSYHLKHWVSVNVKVETAAKLKDKSSTTHKTFEYQDLILVGFSFPLSTADHK